MCTAYANFGAATACCWLWPPATGSCPGLPAPSLHGTNLLNELSGVAMSLQLTSFNALQACRHRA